MRSAPLKSAIVAAVTARVAYALLRARPPGGSKTWTRTNHRGEPITLLEGPAATIGAVAGALAGDLGGRTSVASAVAGIGAAAFGGYDDLAGNGDQRGFRGHLGALRHGELTTGAIKLAGIGLTGLTAAVIASAEGDQAASPALAAADVLINAGLIAGCANLLNLFDLRPGRAIKVAGMAGALLGAGGSGGSAAVAPLASAAALLPEDLGERSMLGDAGANGLGAMLGAAAAMSLSRRSRIAVLSGVAGLTAASEVVSFTRVIERTGPLRWADMLGRRPAAGTGPTPTARPAATTGPADPAEAADPNEAGEIGAHLTGEPVRSAETR
ncbi:MAG: hypothetical protein ACLQFR_15575 [Streptosporangiaceae bacterium]